VEPDFNNFDKYHYQAFPNPNPFGQDLAQLGLYPYMNFPKFDNMGGLNGRVINQREHWDHPQDRVMNNNFFHHFANDNLNMLNQQIYPQYGDV
jgi:hypothetical protein